MSDLTDTKMSDEGTTISTVASLMGCALRDYGIDVEELFRDAGLDRHTVGEP